MFPKMPIYRQSVSIFHKKSMKKYLNLARTNTSRPPYSCLEKIADLYFQSELQYSSCRCSPDFTKSCQLSGAQVELKITITITITIICGGDFLDALSLLTCHIGQHSGHLQRVGNCPACGTSRPPVKATNLILVTLLKYDTLLTLRPQNVMQKHV